MGATWTITTVSFLFLACLIIERALEDNLKIFITCFSIFMLIKLKASCRPKLSFLRAIEMELNFPPEMNDQQTDKATYRSPKP